MFQVSNHCPYIFEMAGKGLERRWNCQESNPGPFAYCASALPLRQLTPAISKVYGKWLRSLIRPSLISPQTKINWSPDHWTPSCDYAQDSLSDDNFVAQGMVAGDSVFGELARQVMCSTHS